MQQPPGRLPSLTAVMACAATLMLCCSLILPARAQDSDLEEVLRRREEQEALACELRLNDSLNEEFYSSASGVESAACYNSIAVQNLIPASFHLMSYSNPSLTSSGWS